MKHKRAWAVVLAAVMALSLGACGEKKETDSRTYSHEITGSVIDADGTAIVIQKGDESLTFNYEGIDVQNFDNRDMELGEDAGDVAIITYTGKINGDSASDCKVTNMAIQPAEEKTLKGQLVDIVSTRSQITVNDGNQDLRFDVSEAERHYSEGIKIGDSLIITYMGEINGSDTRNAYVCSVYEEKLKKDTAKTDVDVEQVNEKVWTKLPANLREGSSHATEVAVSVKEGTALKRTGIGNDGWSRVEYDGKSYCILSSCLSGKKPDKIEEPADEASDTADTNEEAADNANKVMVGRINYITISEDSTTVQFNSEGRYYNFDITGAKLHFLGENTTGNEMELIYTGDMSGGTGPDIKVKELRTIVESLVE